jgi:hypothetical protein
MEKPEVPLEQAQEEIAHHAHESGLSWVMGVALTAAVLAGLAAVTALMAEHHANEAMISQIKASDQWSYYQAKGIKAAVLETRTALLAAMKTQAGRDDEKLKRYSEEQKEIYDEAKGLERESQHHLRRHVPLSRGVTMFQVAIAVAAISALTRRKGYWWLAIGFGVAGLGFLTWGLMIP